jgi:hypothetical protein
MTLVSAITLNGAVLPAAPITPVARDEPDHPDTVDADLLRIAGVCILALVMAILDTTVVSVAQRMFIVDFGSTQAIARGRGGIGTAASRPELSGANVAASGTVLVTT